MFAVHRRDDLILILRVVSRMVPTHRSSYCLIRGFAAEYSKSVKKFTAT